MDRERRNNLRKVIHECRKLLEDEIARRLAYYGIMADGQFLDLAKLPHLTDQEWETRRRLEQAIEKEALGKLTKSEAVKRYIHHVGFTYLNRFAALRAMEVRGSIKKETIVRRDGYGGRSLRERDIAESNPHLTPEQVLKESLIQAFQEVGEEIKVLFDINNEYSLVFPETRACLELIRLLTEEVTDEDWHQDDVIGWIYQYFNSEARKEFRKARQKPRADDIPVINQFYTPDWIVKALVDNTLGRLWLEMHPDSKIRDFCTYFVPLKEKPPDREIKRVRDIKVLDPACGSGHFLVYAFDLLYHMYMEDEPETSPSEVPALILENNLFGIDIDLRSVQLAALSLYLKAKTYSPSLEIRGMNLVCADVRITDSEQRLEFLKRFEDDLALQHIFARLFEELEYTYEIGSLLKVRIPFERLFQEHVSEKGRQARLSLPLTGQAEFGGKGLAGQTKFAFSRSSDSPEALLTLVIPKERTIEEMLDELRFFERESIEAQDMGRLLFATEAEKSVGLLSLLSQRYDVVLMNPPYGDMPARTKEYLRKNYPRTHFDYYAAFIEQAVELCRPKGFVGMLTSSTFLLLRWFQRLREEILWKEAVPEILLDLGTGVLDIAWAQWSATVVRRLTLPSSEEIERHECVFFRLKAFTDEQSKVSAFEESLEAWKIKRSNDLIYVVPMSELRQIPGTRYAYWSSSTLRSLFVRYPPLDKDVARKPRQAKIADVKVGLQTGDDAQFLRFFWEVDSETLAANAKDTHLGKKWVPYSRGTWLSPFYEGISLVVNWENEGKDLKQFAKTTGKPRIQNENFYFREGLTWMTSPQMGTIIKGTLKRLNIRRLPSGCIFASNNAAVFLPKGLLWDTLGLLNSSIVYYLMRMQEPRTLGVGSLASVPFPTEADLSKVAALAKEYHDLLREWETVDETSPIFAEPWILQLIHTFESAQMPITGHPHAKEFRRTEWDIVKQIWTVKGSKEMPLRQLAELCLSRQQMLRKRSEKIEKEIDGEVYRIYKISKEDINLIERELGLQGNIAGNEETQTVDNAQIIEHIERMLSYFVKRAMESDEDGIVPFEEMFPDNLTNKVRELIAENFGADQVDRVEQELYQLLGVTLKEWLAQRYFDFHVSLYKNRPIFWQLASYRYGRSRGPPGIFSCFIHYHRLTRDTIPKIRAFYLERVKEALTREKEHLLRVLEAARATGDGPRINRLSKVYESTLSKIDELERFEAALLSVHNPRRDKKVLPKKAKWVDKAIAEVRNNGWNPIIDYGVRVNIEPLKEAKLLHPAADRVR